MMKVYWEVEDGYGYVGSSRPQSLHIDDDELNECESEEDRLALIHEYVQEDFENKISWYIKRIEE